MSEGVGREPLGAAGSTVIESPSLSVDVVDMRTVFDRLPGMVGSAVRLLADGVEPKESIACRRGMAVFGCGKERWRSEAGLGSGTRASTRLRKYGGAAISC